MWGDVFNAAAEFLGGVPWGEVIGTGAQVAGAAAPYVIEAMRETPKPPPGYQLDFGQLNYPSEYMGSLAGAFPGLQGMENFQGMTPGLAGQMQQPGGATGSQVRRRLADTQAQGLSGASPDFLASMAGVTPEELERMMGMGQY